MFKVGDKVRCINDAFCSTIKTGKAYTVTEVESTKLIGIGHYLGLPPVLYSASRFKLVREAQNPYDINVGDYVRLASDDLNSFTIQPGIRYRVHYVDSKEQFVELEVPLLRKYRKYSTKHLIKVLPSEYTFYPSTESSSLIAPINNKDSKEITTVYIVTTSHVTPTSSRYSSLLEAEKAAEELATINPGPYYVFQAVSKFERTAPPVVKTTLAGTC